MISHKHKCIYIHIPKTSGMTIESSLGVDIKKLHQTNDSIKHGTPKDYIYPRHWSDYFTFTSVRNPWDRLVSAYFFDFRMSTINKNPRRNLIRKLGGSGFSEFVIRHLDTQALIYRPQISWFLDEYDFVIRFENLQEDFNVVCDKIGIPHQQLPHINKSKHKNYIKYYDDETRKIVEEKYAKDIEYFGYEFGG